MKTSIKRVSVQLTAYFLFAVFTTQSFAQDLFFDDFEDRVRDQNLIGNNWTWFDQSWNYDAWVENVGCTGDPSGGFGPFSDGNGSDYPAENNNFWTINGDFDYFRAGLEVPAWEGALSNMMRVYGNQYFGDVQCERVLIFQEYASIEAGAYTFSFDVAQDQYGAPANGEITGAFVKVLKSSDGSFGTLYFETLLTEPPAATSPGDVTTASQSIKFNVPADFEGELLQFGFYNDVSKPLGQSWATSGAYYDNVTLAEAVSGETQYIVRADWSLINIPEEDVNDSVEVTLSCDTPITAFVISNESDPVSVAEKEIVVVLEDGDFITATVQTIDGPSQCQAEQIIFQENVEAIASDECAGVLLEEGDVETCTFEYTIFFEGIPTIDTYGKILMILLLMGAGFIAVRRIV